MLRRSSRGARAVVALALALLLWPARGRADDVADEAELYFKIGAEKFIARDYRGALEYFLRSNRLVKNRNVLFNIAQSYEQLKQLNDAFRYYSLALEGETNATARKAVEDALAALRPRVAILEVETDPAGANLYIDRKDLGARGTTPRSLAFAPGSYRVLADLPGHEDAEPVEVKLELGKTSKVRLTLKKILGTVRVEGAPAGTTASVDGGEAVSLGDGALSLPPGRHQVALRLEGFQDDVQLVDVAANETQVIRSKLTAVVGSVVVATDERDAEILVDGKQVGFTPAVLAVAVGKHTVRLRLPGFREVVREVQVTTGDPVKIEAELRQVEEVSAASRSVEAVEDAPGSVTVLSRQDMRAFAFPTIAEALRGVRGFYVSDNRSYGSVGVRGFARLGDYGQRLLVLLDGHPTNDNYIGSSYVGLDNRVDLEDIERIEVVRGPGSVVYGTNAFLGVVNLVPRQGRGRTGGEVGISTFDYGLARGRARADVALGDGASAWVSVMGARGGGRDFSFPELASANPATGGASRNSDGVDARSAQANFRWKALNVQGFWTSREKVVPTGAYGSVLGDPRTKLRDTRGFVEARFEPKISDSVQLLTRAHVNLYNFRGSYSSPAPTGLGIETFEGRWYGGEARLVISPTRSLRLTVGGEAQLHATAKLHGSDEESGVYLNDNQPFRVAAGYGSADWAVSEALRLSAGARLDYFSTFDGISINPRVAAIVHPRQGTTIKVLGSKAFRAPSIYELYYTDDGTTQLQSLDLKPETVYSGEVELTQRLSSATSLIVAGFVSTVRDLITPVGSGTEADPLRYRNATSPMLLVGGEVELRRDWRQGWMLGLSSSVQKASYQSAGADALRQVPDSPRVLASARGAVPLINRALTLASRVSIEGPRYDRNELPTDPPQLQTQSVAIWDVILSGEETRYGVSYAVGVYNLLDWRYQNPLSIEFPQRTMPQNGRTVLASGKVQF